MEKNGLTTYYRKRNAYTVVTLFFDEYAGLFERLSYGILCAWLRVLAINMVISRNVITIVRILFREKVASQVKQVLGTHTHIIMGGYVIGNY